MQPDHSLSFGPYRFEPERGQVWRGTQEVKLIPKVLAVLRALIMHPGQVVTREELFQVVWPETVVSEATLTSCIQELRQALHDHARHPRYIETAHRRGYRFLPAVTPSPVISNRLSVISKKPGRRADSQPATGNWQLSTPLVGRETELTQLHDWLAKALAGERQVVFVTGEPGIGKTTLVDTFLQSLASGIQNHEARQKAKGKTQKSKIIVSSPASSPQYPTPLLGRGQCIEHYGAGEAYLPMLEALGRLCREAGGEQLIELLRQQAPTWLVQMPALLSTPELEELQRRTAGATRERMLRELAEAIEVMTAERPLVLWLEDLHWSDVSTLDWLAVVARRQERARLLIIGTYRPVEVLAHDHPLKGVKQELQLHGQCEERVLDFLTEADVVEYLAQRFNVGATGRSPLQRLAKSIHQRTDGNPLFMVNVTNELITRKVITNREGHWEIKGELEDGEIGVPVTLRQMIEQRLAQLNPQERAVLEVASVAGAEFSAAAVAAGAGIAVEVVEEQGTELVRREQFLRARGTTEWPDGIVAARYGFVHALYQEVLYERLTATRRMRLHRQIGEREEQGYGERASEIAAELAVHFERGRDYSRSIQYLQQAAENAFRRSAHQEAITLLTKGLELLKTLPDTPERVRQELVLQTTLGAALTPVKGYSAVEVEQVYARARELCLQVGKTPQLFPVLWGLWAFYLVRAELQTAYELGEQCLTLAQSVHDPAFLLGAQIALGHTSFHMGDFASAHLYEERASVLYNPQQHRSLAFFYNADPGVGCCSYAALALWLLGYPDQALKKLHQAFILTQGPSHPPHSSAFALAAAVWFHQLRGERQTVEEQAEAVIALSDEQEFPLWLAWGVIFRGWALARQGQGEEGIALLRQGIGAWRATAAEGAQPYWLAMLAEACGLAGQTEEGLSVLAKALEVVDKTGERFYEAELYRLKGELVLKQFGVRGSESREAKQKAKSKRQKAKVETNPQSLTPNPQGDAEQEAEGYFLKAIEIAREQSAKSWELRAATSLARLWQQQGKQQQAHKLLAEIYHWFTEGFDTKDLQEAKALLAELEE